MKRLLLVVSCGGLGSGTRYLLAGWVARVAGASFPYGTLSVNAIGSFLIAGIMSLSLTTVLIGPDLRLALTTGVMGGFTTYSTFDYESLSLFQQGAWLLGCLNVAVTVLLCLSAGAAGLFIARWLTARPWSRLDLA